MKPVRVTFFDKEATQVTFQVRESELHTGRWFFIDMPYFERIELQVTLDCDGQTSTLTSVPIHNVFSRSCEERDNFELECKVQRFYNTQRKIHKSLYIKKEEALQTGSNLNDVTVQDA